jgi:hypothetical protein
VSRALKDLEIACRRDECDVTLSAAVSGEDGFCGDLETEPRRDDWDVYLLLKPSGGEDGDGGEFVFFVFGSEIFPGMDWSSLEWHESSASCVCVCMYMYACMYSVSWIEEALSGVNRARGCV